MRKLTASLALAATAATVLPVTQVHAEEVYGLYLTGVQVVQTSRNGEDPFIVAYGVEEDGDVSRPVFIPAENQPWQNVHVGDVFQRNDLIWRGRAQDLMLQAHVYHYDTGARGFVAGFTQITSAVAGALIAVGTGGTGAAAGAIVAIAGERASAAVRDTAGNSVPLGEVHQSLELRRVGSLADRPQYEHQGVWYDFYTEHNWNGALYGLFWEVRRL